MLMQVVDVVLHIRADHHIQLQAYLHSQYLAAQLETVRVSVQLLGITSADHLNYCKNAISIK